MAVPQSVYITPAQDGIGGMLTLATKPALPSHFFKTAHMSSKVGAFPSDHFTSTWWKLVDPDHGVARRQILGDFFSWAWSKIKQVAGYVQAMPTKVEGYVKDFVNIAKIVATGDYKYDKNVTLAELSWNYNSVTKSASDPNLVIDGDVICSNCFFYFDLALDFGFDIESYSLKKTYLYARGDLDTHLAISATLSQSLPDLEVEKLVTTIKLAPICFTVGVVPICVNTDIPIVLGLDMQAMADATVTGQVSASGYLEAGFVYSDKDKNLHGVYNRDLVHDGSVSSSATIQMTGQIYILPSFVFVIDHIGGPSVGIKTSLDMTAVWQSFDSPCSPDGGAALSIALNAGLDVTLGGKISINIADRDIYDKDLGQKSIYTGKWPIDSFCLNVDLNGLPEASLEEKALFELLKLQDPQDPPYVTTNMAFQGTAISTCIGVPSPVFHANILNDTSVIFSGNNAYNETVPPVSPDDTYHPYNVRTTNQDSATALFPGPGSPFQITQTFDPTVENVIPFETGYATVPLNGFAQVADDFSYLQFNATNPCFQPALMTRVATPHPKFGRARDRFTLLPPSSVRDHLAATFQLQAFQCSTYFENLCFDLSQESVPVILSDVSMFSSGCRDGGGGKPNPSYSMPYLTSCYEFDCLYGAKPVKLDNGTMQPNACNPQGEPMPGEPEPPRPPPQSPACTQMVDEGICQCTPAQVSPGESFYMVNCFSTDTTEFRKISFPDTQKIALYNIEDAHSLFPMSPFVNIPSLRVLQITNTNMGGWFMPIFLDTSKDHTGGRIQQVILRNCSLIFLPSGALQGNDWSPDKFQQLAFIIDVSNNLFKWLPLGIFDDFFRQTGDYNMDFSVAGNPWINEAGMCKCKDPTKGLQLVAKSHLEQQWCECNETVAGRSACSCE